MLFFLLCTAFLSLTVATQSTLDIVSSRRLLDCPVNGTLTEPYLNPTLMVPVSKKLPNHPFGPTKKPVVTPNDFCTIFNLVIPPTAVGKTCTLEFLFPNHIQTPNPFLYSGGGHFTFTGYAFGSGATKTTTYNKQPPAGPSPPQPPAVLKPGNAYTINVGGCAIEKGMSSLTVSGMLCSADTSFWYKQSDEKCPIGFFVSIS
ncbi:ubiquitin 3 binding protein But2 C-terminal domain-containing protein [Bisporella sp. PMI_857]|nr:ubiquitin 3 binding protein But2 C-terminal domain-containing protein [Bisporella sp. PMI_857]